MEVYQSRLLRVSVSACGERIPMIACLPERPLRPCEYGNPTMSAVTTWSATTYAVTVLGEWVPVVKSEPIPSVPSLVRQPFPQTGQFNRKERRRRLKLARQSRKRNR